MRTQTAGEVTLLGGANYGVHQRVYVANGSGTLIDLSGYVERIGTDEDIDQPTVQTTVEFRRDASSTLSLAPLRTDSTLNRLDDGTTYSAQLDAGRLITIEVATVAIGSTPSGSDWKEIFRGYVDSVDAASPTVVVVARDLGGVLVDRWIETEKAYGYDESIETVMQQIIDDTLGAGVVTLTITGTPSFNIRTYTQESEPLMDALRGIAQLIGWDVRYTWNGSAFTLELYEPPRTNTTPDRSFTAAMYYTVTRLMLDRADVRNFISINYRNSVAGYVRKDMTTSDATSIARYGRRFFGLTEGDDSSIDTDAEASLLIGNILSDLKDPKAEMEIEAQFFWPAELGDLYRFPDNDVHFNSNQDWAVTNIRHDLYGGTGRTFLQVRGTPAGGYLAWTQVQRKAPEKPLFGTLSAFREVERTNTTLTMGWAPTTETSEFWAWEQSVTQPVTTDPWAAFTGAPTRRLTGATTSYAWDIPNAGTVTYVRIRAMDVNGILGDPWDFTVQGEPTRLLQRATPISASTTATQSVVRVAVADPLPTVDVTITYDAGGLTVTPATGQVIASGSVTNDISTTGYVDFTITKPAYGSPPGRVTFTATASFRQSDVDSVDISTQDRVFTVDTIDTTEIEDAAITAAKIGAAAVETAKLANLAVTDAILAANAVTTTKITDTAVTSAKIAANTIVAGNIAAGTITTTEIAANTIVAGNIAAGAIEASEIAAGAVTTAKLDALAVTADKIAANTITAAKIAALTITAAEIAASTITAAKMSVTDLSAITANIGTITAGKIRNTGDTNFVNLDATGTGEFIKSPGMSLTADGALTLSKVVKIIGSGTAPTLSAPDAVFTGTGSSTSITGTDTAGRVTLTANNTGGTATTGCTVTFATAYATAPFVVVTPVSDAGVVVLVSPVAGSPSTTSFFIGFMSSKAFGPNEACAFHYSVVA